ncbi:hypothetical protein J2W55_004017 [Mucilaginibacter pocheonensis]|uniref:Uncharacterized protein n=1 Tax=Mucilaginibacter pocheonensis TaxID=398050 RepID=A0ABU1TFG7_9SPHI|nr:hypothetical protein [Mucilaginibacter pocheonensis]
MIATEAPPGSSFADHMQWTSIDPTLVGNYLFNFFKTLFTKTFLIRKSIAGLVDDDTVISY